MMEREQNKEKKSKESRFERALTANEKIEEQKTIQNYSAYNDLPNLVLRPQPPKLCSIKTFIDYGSGAEDDEKDLMFK